VVLARSLIRKKDEGRTGSGRVIEFGKRIKGVSYINRPGAYAIIRDGSNAIALVRTQQGYLLPGGGVEPNEDIEIALKREIMEELGYQSTIEEKVCSAVQYLYSESEHAYFKKIGHFFKMSLAQKVSEPIELDHELVWCSFEESLQMLAQKFQAWAVGQAFK
jgi:8-oxo-dGTP diphosphatase